MIKFHCWGFLSFLALSNLRTTAGGRRLPETFDLDEAIKKSQEKQREDREKRRRQKQRAAEREKHGLPPEEDTDDMWKRFMGEGANDETQQATGPNQGFNRTIEPTMYVVTGTTPFREVDEEELPRGHLLASKQPPFVHWMCYRGRESNLEDLPAEQLACCQEIFRAMEQAPEKLCWRADIKSCGSGPGGLDLSKPLDIGKHMDGTLEEEMKNAKQIHATSKAEFMTHCTHQIARIPSNTEIATPAATAAAEDLAKVGVPPRWSLVIAPDVMSNKPTLAWRQYVLLRDGKFGMWIKNAPSPIQISRPLRVVEKDAAADSSSGDNENEEVIVTRHIHSEDQLFGATLVSRIVESEQDDEMRDFTHRLTLDVSKIVRIAEDEAYNVDLTVLFALPNELRLPKPRKGQSVSDRALSACRSTCGSPSCKLAIVEAPVKVKKKASVWGQQSVAAVTVRIENLDATESKKKKKCEFSWRTTMLLEDEEPLLVAPPLLYQGFLKRQNSDDEKDAFVWDEKLNPVGPLLTDLEERERLEDLWKVEL